MTKEEFKKRWSAPNCDITFADIADCAKEWGLHGKPKCFPIDAVRYSVLVAAGCEDAEDYRPEDEQDIYKSISYSKAHKTEDSEECVVEADKADLVRELWYRMRDRGEIQWRTKDGRMIPIKDMTDTHLLNALRMLRRRDEFDELGYEAMLDSIDSRRDW